MSVVGILISCGDMPKANQAQVGHLISPRPILYSLQNVSGNGFELAIYIIGRLHTIQYNINIAILYCYSNFMIQ